MINRSKHVFYMDNQDDHHNWTKINIGVECENLDKIYFSEISTSMCFGLSSSKRTSFCVDFESRMVGKKNYFMCIMNLRIESEQPLLQEKLKMADTLINIFYMSFITTEVSGTGLYEPLSTIMLAILQSMKCVF